MKKWMILAFILIALLFASWVWSGSTSMKMDMSMGPGTQVAYENYQVDDGLGGWENYQTSDGEGGWENYQVRQ